MLERILTIVFFAFLGVFLIWNVPYTGLVAGALALTLAIVHAVKG